MCTRGKDEIGIHIAIVRTDRNSIYFSKEVKKFNLI
jgi:hypothetical protein